MPYTVKIDKCLKEWKKILNDVYFNERLKDRYFLSSWEEIGRNNGFKVLSLPGSPLKDTILEFEDEAAYLVFKLRWS